MPSRLSSVVPGIMALVSLSMATAFTYAQVVPSNRPVVGGQAAPIRSPAKAVPAAKPVVKAAPKQVAKPVVSQKPVAPAAKAPAAKPAAPAAKAVANQAVTKPDRLRSEHLLPGYTKAWLSIPDIKSLKEDFGKTQFGQLASNDSIKPFIDSLSAQFNNWADQKNMRLGIKLENLDEIYSGEICLAGAVPTVAGQKPERGSHGLVLLVDVKNSQAEAEALLSKINKRLVKEGAVQDIVEINGAQVTRSRIEKTKRLRNSQTTMQTIFDGWLLASDNEKIFRDVMFRLATVRPDALKADSLAAQGAFQAVNNRAGLGRFDSHVRWFADPFGYVRLAQALADDEKKLREHNDDWARILQEQGFDAIKAIGGQVGFLTGEHELLHRTFVYAPRKNLVKDEQRRVFGLFDFSNKTGKPVGPAAWVPSNLSAFFVGKWNMTSALENVGHLYDAFLDDPGAFERVLQDFKQDPDMQLNIRKLVEQFDDEWTIVSATEQPVAGSSERVAIGFKIKQGGDGDFVLKSIERAIGRGNANKIKLLGVPVIEVDATVIAEDEDIPDDLFDDPLDGDDFEDEDEDEDPQFALFDKKYFAVAHGFLIVANNKDYMKRLLASKQKTQLQETDDYIQVREALEKMADNKVVSSRQFGRLDRALEANYEMLRQGKMASSNTVLAKIVNRIFADQAKEDGKELPRLDGKALPKNFKKSIAPFLGVMGWVNEVEADGWRISGCVLKRQGKVEVAKQK